jgi:hypothetical protein
MPALRGNPRISLPSRAVIPICASATWLFAVAQAGQNFLQGPKP